MKVPFMFLQMFLTTCIFLLMDTADIRLEQLKTHILKKYNTLCVEII